MNKQTYLAELRQALSGMPEAELKDILYDYEEHFDAALASGEAEAAILEQLGRPEVVAKQFRLSKVIQRAESKPSSYNLFRAVVASVGLGLFNVIFILGPYLALATVLIVIFAVGAGLVIAGIGMAFGGLVSLVSGAAAASLLLMTGLDQGMMVIALLGVGVALAAVGGLILLAAVKLTKLFYQATLSYLKLNVRIIQQK